MKQIREFQLLITEEQNVEMPEGAHILAAELLHERLFLWAIVDPDAVPRPRRILIAGTGHPRCFDGLRHISTLQSKWYSQIWHVFEPEDV